MKMINKTFGIVVGFLAAGLMFGCAKKSNVNVENAGETNPPNESTDIHKNAESTLEEEEDLATSYYFEEYDSIELAKDGAGFSGSRGGAYGCPSEWTRSHGSGPKEKKSLNRAIDSWEESSINRTAQDGETVEQLRRDQDL